MLVVSYFQKISLYWNMYLVLQQKLFLDFVKKTMTTQPINNNATVMAKAMNGDGDSESRGGGSRVRWRQPQLWWQKEHAALVVAAAVAAAARAVAIAPVAVL